MKVKLTRRLGQNQAGSIVHYDERTARWLIGRGLGAEVQNTTPDEPNGDVPPQSGKGSGRDTWAVYAGGNGVTVNADDGRDDIIAACETAGIPVE